MGSVIKLEWQKWALNGATIEEFLEFLKGFESLAFKRGRWQRARLAGMMDYIRMDFGPEFGKQYSVPMFLEEMRLLPQTYPSLQQAGFFVGGFNWFVDWLVMPIGLVALKISPEGAMRPVGKLMGWGLKTFSKPPYGSMLKLEARGAKNGQSKAVDVTLFHKDGYQLTAIPVAACLLQYLDGSIRKPGLWTQANLVDPMRLMSDMQRMGVEIHVQER